MKDDDTRNASEKRYQFSDKYDILIQKSEITGKEKYTLVTKRDKLKSSKDKGDYISLNAEKIIYDDDHIYLYSNRIFTIFLTI